MIIHKQLIERSVYVVKQTAASARVSASVTIECP